MMPPRGPEDTPSFGFGMEAEMWTIAAQKMGKWYDGVLETDERLMNLILPSNTYQPLLEEI